MLFSATACNDEKEVANNSTTNTSVNESTSSEAATEVKAQLLTTEYEIEDYLDNAIIVSKNDGLLYGLIDNNGNEIIPVKYDDMEFLNDGEYLKNESEEIYILAKYENVESIFDVKGKMVLETVIPEDYEGPEPFVGLGYIRYYDKSVKVSDNTPVFYEKLTDNSINLYNKKYQKVGSTIKDKYNYTMCYINDKFSIAYNSKIYILDYNNSVLNSFDKTIYTYPTVYGDKCYLKMIDKNEDILKGNNVTTLCLDSNGNILETKKFATKAEFDVYFKSISEQYKTEDETEKENFKCYKTNSTYKVEDLNGNPLYAERYYKSLSVNGENNDCHFLTDEDDNVCIFGSQGHLYVKFGEYVNRDGKLYLLSQDGEQYIEEVYEGKNSIALVYKTSQGTQVKFHYFK